MKLSFRYVDFLLFHLINYLIIKVIYSPTNPHVIVLKTLLKFTLQQLRRVSV